MAQDYDRSLGRRITRWADWKEGDVDRLVEATGEHPIMYIALGTEPQTGHPYNLYGDIKSQPQALRDTFAHTKDVIPALAQKIVDRGLTRGLGTGLGTSQFVAMAAAGAFWAWAGMDMEGIDSLEFISTARPYDWSKMVYFAYSGSGSTVDSNRAARKAAEAGAYAIALTSVAGSPITQLCEDVILCAGGFDTGGSDTFHYTTRLGVSLFLALEIGRRRRPDAMDYDAMYARLMAIPDRLAEVFDYVDARCHTIARQFKDVRAALVVGGGPNLGTAEEIALKYDEMAHIPTKGMCPGRHIHGALGLTDHRILTIIVAPPGPTYKELADIARATVMLKTPSVGIVSEDDTEIAPLCDYVIRLPTDDENLFTLLAILPGQLLPYWSAVELGGINPDCQRANIPKHARVWNMFFPPGTH
ncbi:MAG: SIS domain-containing protein [Anaerolineae bacterium]|nr:SIS domain-containing protein [Anaerolineae bacterium]